LTTKPKNNRAGIAYLAEIIGLIHSRFTPHAGQIRVGRKLFNDGCKRVFVQCGRKWGKSEFLIYSLLRWAALKDGQACYYFAPFQKQAREIIWQRMLQFIPETLVAEVNKTEGRITLTNGSFIKVDGSDNYEAYRGVTPDIVALDEFKDFRPEFFVAMEPNLLPKKAPLLICGTPPDHECQYTEIADEIRQDSSGYWIEAPTSENPHIDPEYLEKVKEKLHARNEVDTWMREYMGRFVKGGKASIFPMLDFARHVVDYAALKRQLIRDLHKFQWFMIADPGTTSIFGSLVVGMNPYTRHLYVFDEIYESDPKKTTTGQIWPLMQSMMLEAHPSDLPGGDRWYRIYDEAAAWFAAESLDRYNVGWVPTRKAAAAKEDGLGLIKDLLLNDCLTISSRCEKLLWEMTNYIKDANGKIPKKNDHLIDCLRYLLQAANYTTVTRAEPKPIDKSEGRRAFTMEEDYTSENADMPDNYYD
jgi:Terminase large subunit, T4likevirus-type, N-terminal